MPMNPSLSGFPNPKRDRRTLRIEIQIHHRKILRVFRDTPANEKAQLPHVQQIPTISSVSILHNCNSYCNQAANQTSELQHDQNARTTQCAPQNLMPQPAASTNYVSPTVVEPTWPTSV
eukprot:scaffold233570_cov24-Attheya_sp.AAC.1